MFPGQEEALRSRLDRRRPGGILADDGWLRSRRTFLGLGIGGLLGVTTGGLVGLGGASVEAREGGESAARSDAGRESAWMQGLALGPLDELLGEQSTFMQRLVSASRFDDVALIGAVRLANAIIEGNSRVAPGLEDLFFEMERDGQMPIYMRHWVELIRCQMG